VCFPVLEQIVACAARIRQELAKIAEMNILRLSEHLGERGLVTYQALGWLAHDGVVRYTERHEQIYVSLAERQTPRADRTAHGTEKPE
jgi:hypothetical protein